jgi:AraC-like DNA-binding protein
MLVGMGRWSAGPVAADTVVVIDRAVWALAVRRRGLVFDSRFISPVPIRRDIATLYVIAAGWMQPHGEDAQPGPSLWVLREDELEQVAPGGRTFRCGGALAITATIVVPVRHVRVPIGLAHGPRPLGPRSVAVMDDLHDAPSIAGKKDAFRELLADLAEQGIVERAVVDELGVHEPPTLVRMWNAVAAIYERQDTALYVDLLASLSRLSPRQVQRESKEIAARMGFHGFRDVVRNARLRRASMLLSAVELSVTDVARVVGYGSVDAMGRAFRDAGLPPPRDVRDAILAP